jgi:AAHS family 4-hydroxybenzoate transporter-like MFS transporter
METEMIRDGVPPAGPGFRDDGRLSGYQIIVIILCATIAVLDGFDTQAVGFVAPVIAGDWGLPLADFGTIFAVGLLGGLLGAVLFGMIADRKGRRLTLIVTVALFALGSLLTALARTSLELGLFRFGTGLGLGGAMPSIIALTSEYSPARLRNTLITAMFCGFPLGAVVGALVSTPLIERFGWESVFLLGGIVPLTLLPALALWIPESIGWLIGRGDHVRVDAILARIGKAPARIEPGPAGETSPPRSSIAGLFAGGRAFGTLLLALVFFVSLLIVYLMVSWVPGIAVQAGHSVRFGVLSAGVLNLTGIAGSLTIGRLSDRRGAYRVVGSAYLLGALAIAVLALAAAPGTTILIFCILAGFFCIGSQMCAVSIASQFYPVDLRGTGVGWSMGMGRFGAIAGPLIGATLVGANGAEKLFELVAALSAVAGIGILVMGLVVRRQG